MVKITPEHWDAVHMRSEGHTYATIALEQRCSVDQARQRVADVSRVLSLRLTAEQSGEESDGEADSG